MAQTRKRRRRKHRGTQAGTIETPGRTGRTSRARSTTSKPKTRAEARDVARQRRQARFDQPPTWRGSLNRALVAAAILAVFISVVQKNVAAGIILGAFAVIIYVPMSYYTDLWLYRRRQRQKQKSAS
jgi:Flp pilus assembly protein TadB